MTGFCCKKISTAVIDAKAVDYDNEYRYYAILFEPNGSFALDYCPWCGIKLPERLNTLIYDVIYEEYGIPYYDLDMDEFVKEHPEFSTDEWWKKRGL